MWYVKTMYIIKCVICKVMYIIRCVICDCYVYNKMISLNHVFISFMVQKVESLKVWNL